MDVQLGTLTPIDPGNAEDNPASAEAGNQSRRPEGSGSFRSKTFPSFTIWRFLLGGSISTRNGQGKIQEMVEIAWCWEESRTYDDGGRIALLSTADLSDGDLKVAVVAGTAASRGRRGGGNGRGDALGEGDAGSANNGGDESEGLHLAALESCWVVGR